MPGTETLGKYRVHLFKAGKQTQARMLASFEGERGPHCFSKAPLLLQSCSQQPKGREHSPLFGSGGAVWVPACQRGWDGALLWEHVATREICFKITITFHFHKVSQQRHDTSLHPPLARSHQLCSCSLPCSRQPGRLSLCWGLAGDFVSDHNACLEIISAHRGCCIPRAALWSPEELVLYLRDSRVMVQGPTWVPTCASSRWSWEFPHHPC